MHDPCTVAHEIYLGGKKKRNGEYRRPLITIWHVDPEKDGTDDSCGWFKRERHVNQQVLAKIKKEFQFNFKHHYWFDANGYRQFSAAGLLLNMYRAALWQHYNGDHTKVDKFLQRHLHEIMLFAENPTDCIGDTITRKRGENITPETMDSLAGIIYTWIIRKELKWWQHPRWHIRHWKVQIHPLQKLKRRYWDKCAVCGKRGFPGSAYGDWSGTRIWHEHCDTSRKQPESK